MDQRIVILCDQNRYGILDLIYILIISLKKKSQFLLLIRISIYLLSKLYTLFIDYIFLKIS